MAIQANVTQSSKEKLIYPIDWTRALLTDVTLVDVTIVHTPPTGDAVTFGKQLIGLISYVKAPEGLVVGTHQVSVVASTSNSDLCPEVLLVIVVDR